MEEKDMLNSHEEIIHKNILPRLDVVEKAQAAFQQEVATIKSDLMGVQRGQAQLELTVMKDGKETRDMLKQFVNHVLDQDKQESQAKLEDKKAETQSKIEARKARWEIIGKVTVVLAGSGSIIYAWIELLKDKL
ncbi:hypothetical protein LC048_13525 [Mesobacillus subterraneus]|uniref:hypothetical protein n=1 Tax=Mesobacillus subterraneus TaxID=285983 RepID=UPI001CFE26AC|nr:hypothetical protein [Mesobacillus subterraneus]WLR53543.1 hypothetical protein LC048_13525 [Mesobacillus subterraneus]